MIEKIYNDFTTQLLPKISEGLAITKDYFLDFFGRYVKYLIVMDSICTFIGLVGIVACLIYAKRIIQWQKDVGMDKPVILLLIVPSVIFTVVFFENLSNLAKDIFVPEIRVMEKMSEYIK